MVAWPAVFLYSLCVHLCMCPEFYCVQRLWHLCYSVFCRAFHSLPPLPYLFVGLGFGLGLVLCLIYLVIFSTELLVSV